MDRVFTDTTNFFAIDYGDIIEVEGRRYLIKGHEREDRFGLDEPKFWVKKGVDMETEPSMSAARKKLQSLVR